MAVVSIIVPVYNVEKYLRRCIDSILSQTYTDFELIIIDDGSNDNSGAICDEYAITDRRIHVIHQKNRGVSAARNYGIYCASGSYIMFVDSDDYLDETCVEVLLNNIIIRKADICVASVQMISEDGNKLSRETCNPGIYTGRDKIDHFGNRNDDTFRCPLCKLIKTRICKTVSFPEDRFFAEDFAVVYKWYDIAGSIVEINDELYYYQIREGSAVHSDYSLNKIGEIQSLEELLAFLDDNDYQDLYQVYLHRYLWQIADQIKKLRMLNRHKKEERVLIKKARKAIKLNHRDISPENDPDIFNIVYPGRMWIYWNYKAVWNRQK